MKKIVGILGLSLFFSCVSGTDPMPNEFSFDYKIHTSLPSTWESEFYTIVGNLNEKIKIEPRDYSYQMSVYAWKSTASKPYQSQIGDASGASVSGNQNERYMVLEIPASEFDFAQLHRYSVIPHEYFHVYQMSLSKNFYDGNIELKWISEGGAATIESMYIQQYYGVNYIKDAQNQVNIAAINNPKIFEKYNDSQNEDPNYSSSVFMVLALAKELQKLNHTEEDAFKMIFKDFWLPNPTNGNWKNNFEEVFGISVENFYQSLSNYSNDINSVLPSETILIEDIFTN